MQNGHAEVIWEREPTAEIVVPVRDVQPLMREVRWIRRALWALVLLALVALVRAT